ncbi:hypothetical protein ACLOJK_019142 [Asimina triloba]
MSVAVESMPWALEKEQRQSLPDDSVASTSSNGRSKNKMGGPQQRANNLYWTWESEPRIFPQRVGNNAARRQQQPTRHAGADDARACLV